MKTEAEVRKFVDLLRHRLDRLLHGAIPGCEPESAETSVMFMAPLLWVLEDKDAETNEVMDELLDELAELKDEDVSRN